MISKTAPGISNTANEDEDSVLALGPGPGARTWDDFVRWVNAARGSTSLTGRLLNERQLGLAQRRTTGSLAGSIF
jgi:hypothetical protein